LSTSIILVLIFISCAKNEPRWTYEDPENFIPDGIQLELCTLEGLKLRTTRDDLIRQWGQPTRQIEGGGTLYGKDIIGKKRYDSTVWFSAYYYDNVRFAVWRNNATIETVDFRNSGTKINGPGFSLSAETDLAYIQVKFLTSYEWRNIGGINTARDRFFDPHGNEVNEIELTWVDLQNEHGQNVELTFVDNKLAFLINIVVD